MPRYLGGWNHSRDRHICAVSYFYEADDFTAAEAAFFSAEERLIAGGSR